MTVQYFFRVPSLRLRRDRAPCHASSGFTLIELLVVLAILGVLTHLLLPTAQLTYQRHKEDELRRVLREIRHGIDAYKRAGDEGHILKKAGTTGYPPDLNTLVEGVSDQRDPEHHKMYFLRRIPRDPLNHDAHLSNSETWGKRSYASDADNPQEGDDVYDVYSTSADTGLNGVPYKQW